MAASSKEGDNGTDTFYLDSIASIERRSFGELFPNTLGGGSLRTEKQRDEAHSLEAVRIAARDGRSTSAGWQQSANKAALIQSGLSDYVANLRRRLSEQDLREKRNAEIGPDDAPL